ncbi:hypothetical protein RRG08_021251 [Elysia crispata]|nr:hypothetical protein RRG08_021251 [Elysia crispata]
MERQTPEVAGVVLAVVLLLVLPGTDGQAQVYAPVGDSASVTIQLPDQNTNIISPSGQTMIEVGFFGDPTVSQQYRNRVSVTNYSGGFGTPSISFTFSNVQLTDGGNFQCTSTFGGNTQCGPTLVVLGRPTLPQLTVTPNPVVAGRDVEMTCAATSTSQPPSASLVLVYVLKQNGNVITQPRTSSFLIKGISATNAGTRFQCTAYELNTVTNRLTGFDSGESDVYTLDPQYAPTVIGVSPNQTSFTLKRDETIPDIECSAACNPACDFQWYKAPNRESIVAQGPVLRLGTVTSDEDGTYVCAAVNTLGERLLPVKVEVQESLGEVTFDPAPDSYTVREGTAIPAILCNSECVPACKFEWFKDGRFLYESDGINFGEVGRADSGDYTCRATNDRGSREKNLKIQVEYPPGRASLTPAALNYELEENAAILPDISCSADCEPDCEILWQKEGNEGAVSFDFLALGTATRADTGRYQCLVRNQYGEQVSNVVNVKIYYSPESIAFEPLDSSYNVEEGTNLEPVTCSANCEPACSLNWYKDNELSTPTVADAILDLGLADQADAGLWTCVATNAYGSQSKQLRVNIAYGPKDMTLMPARELYSVAADTESMPDVMCTANCNPPCSFSWFKNNDPFPDALNNTLSLGSVARGDEGNYTCRASNRLDADTRSLRLVITYGPSSSITLDPPQTRYELGVGSSLDVSCSAVCDPDCSYTWVRDDGTRAASSGNLQIASVSPSDAGVYTCRAANDIGPPATASITVNILSGPESLSITPEGPISLEEGNDFVISCSASCTPACTFTWRKGGQLIQSQGGTLPLTNVTRSDAGMYTCEARNSVDTTFGQVQVEVEYGAGESISLIPDSQDIKVRAGDLLEVTCVAGCYPECNFRWFKGTNEFSSGPKLTIPAISVDQGGPYTCIAQNSANNPAFSSTVVDVVYGPRQGEPEIFPPEPIQSVSRGGSYQARCSADCNPECDISWFFGTSEVPSSNGILNLRSVTSEDAGAYSCRASNSVESASQSFNLQVQAGPGTTIKFNPPGATQEVIEGRLLSVTCSAECSPPCSFYWQIGSRNVSDSGDLTFDPIQRDDAGNYVCYASNDLDSLSSKQLEVKVMYGPEGSTRLIPDGTKNLDVGDTLNFVCVADCSPPCEYTWYLGQQQILSSNGEVRVDSVSLSDSGTYSCQANNGVGARETKSVSVFVQSGPGGSISFNPPNDTVTLTEGNTLQVTCAAQCTPSCFYVWTLGQREIPSTNGVLNIPAVSAEQKGDYTCVAANGEGNQASKVLSVDVLYGPGDSLELVPADAVQTLNEGASLQINCRSMCNPPCEHQWYFVTTPLNTTNGVLSLVSLSADNEGNYKCVAFNGVGRSKEMDVLIKVQTGPGNTVRIIPDQRVYEVNEKSPLQLQCEAVCSPACTYTWYFGGTRIRATDGLFLQEAAKREDAGPYVCYAANAVAVQGSRQIQVDVLHGPTDKVMLDPSGPQRIEVGDMLTFRCSASCKPDCQYRWFKGNSEVYSEGGRLVVGPATEANRGDYSCQAYNKVDSLTSDIISIEILKPPENLQFRPLDENPSVVEGSDVEVLCQADCIPDCEISWWRGEEEIPGTYLDGTLRLKNVRRDEIHFYTCYAFNGVGSPASKLLVLEVLYGPETVSVFPPEVIAPLGGSVSVSCQADCNPPCQMFWSKDATNVSSKAGILTLGNVEADKSGNYSCTASNEVGAEAETVPITIISGGGATVQFDPPDTSVVVSEGRSYKVTCQSRCAPECQVTWTRGGEPVASSAGDILQFASVARSDKGVYSCRATNAAGIDISQLFSLDVTYGPGSSVGLIPPVYSRRLSVGDSLVSRCEADCSPSCEIVWVKDGNLLPGITGGDLLISSVTANNAGLYQCVADNNIGRPGVAELAVTVSFGPVNGSVSLVPPDRVRPVLEGEPFLVTCMAECLPTCTYTWFVGNFKYQANNGTLRIDRVSQSDAGTYTCHADNGVGQTRMLDLLLIVEYSPSGPSLEPPTAQYRVSAGLDLPGVTCSADCSPQCDVRWLKDGQLLQQGSQLSLGQAGREDVGSYTCITSNVHGATETEMTVNVDYQPVITLFTVRDRKFSAIVKEGLPVKLSCQVEADPAADVSFYNGSQLIYSQDSTREISYAWPRASCFDAGNYICFADNGVGNSVKSSVNLEVLCSPRLDPRIFKQPFVASQIGGTAVITVPVVADPPPSFLWYKKQGSGVEYIDPVDGKEESERFFYVNGTSSTLVIKNVQQGDFGDYVVSVANTQGTDNITFGLVTEGPPYKPGRLTAVPVSPGVVELTWSPGFNGGDDQQFVIEFQKSGSGEWRRIDKPVMDKERMVQANITDLHPLTEYTFRLRGLNSYGYSNYSNPVVIVTQDDPEASRVRGDVSTTPVLLGVGCALGFLVGAGITAMVVVSRCKPKTGRHHGENTIDDYKSDTTYDTLYLKDALWAQRHIKLSNDSFKSGVSPYTSYDFMQQDDTQVR